MRSADVETPSRHLLFDVRHEAVILPVFNWPIEDFESAGVNAETTQGWLDLLSRKCPASKQVAGQQHPAD